VTGRRIDEFFANHGIGACSLIAAVSGGVDSTALLLLLADLRERGFDIRAAHVNHHLRDAESDEDEAFVRALCAQLDIALDVADGTLDPERVRARGIEAAAREVRYARLLEIRERRDAQFIATAHQKNDQAETVLMRLLTGSGIAGLRGIHPMRDDGVIRPLLDFTRDDLERVLQERNVTPRFDRSNADPRFLRNRVRVVIRDLEATDNLAAIAGQARAQWPILERAIDDAEREHAHVREDETTFTTMPDDEWLRGALLQRHIRRLDPQARDFDARRIDLGSKRVSVTKHVELVRDGGALKLRRRNARIDEPNVTIRVEPGRQPPTANRQRIQLPEGADPTFETRTRRPGDRFQPLGLLQPKKLKDFLIDRKIARDSRDRLPLLLWNGEIVWIAGVEVSERFKVTEPARGTVYEVWLEGSGADDADHSPV
jgi:tRNA(Ile)-lysidine synthase